MNVHHALRRSMVVVGLLDRVFDAAFGRHARQPRHEHNRLAHTGANLPTAFRIYLARLYGTGWMIGVGIGVVLVAAGYGVGLAGGVTVAVRLGIVWIGCRYLHWRALARQRMLEQTLPATVRHLRILSTGELDSRALLSEIATTQELYGETAVSFRRVLNRAQLGGSLSRALREIAKETPSEVFSSFLLRLQAAIGAGEEALTDHLELEARMLRDHQRRGQTRQIDYAKLVGRVVGLVFLAPVVIAFLATAGGVVTPALEQAVTTPVGNRPLAVVILYACLFGVLVVGLIAAVGAGLLLRPTNGASVTGSIWERPAIETVLINPISTFVVGLPVAVGISVGLVTIGVDTPTAVVYGYTLLAIPTGLVGLRHDQRSLAKDRALREFVHGLAAVTGRGRSFSEAVEEVSNEYHLRPLTSAVSTLAFNLRVSARGSRTRRQAALSNFAETVDTPLAYRLSAVLSSAFAAGCDTPQLFELLEEDLDQLYHQRQTDQATLRGYVALLWAIALGTAVSLAAIGIYILDGGAQLPSTALEGSAAQPTAYDLYLLAEAVALACGWVAGVLNGTRGGAFLHSGVLAMAVFIGFRFAGLT